MAAEGRSAVEIELGIDVARAQGELRELASTFVQSFAEVSSAGSEAGRAPVGRATEGAAATSTATRGGGDDIEELRRKLLASVKQVSEQAGRSLPVVRPGTSEDVSRSLQAEIDKIRTGFVNSLKQAVTGIGREKLGLNDAEISRLQREANVGSRVSNTYRRSQAAILAPVREEEERERVVPPRQTRRTTTTTTTTTPEERPEPAVPVVPPTKRPPTRARPTTAPAEQVVTGEAPRSTPGVAFNKALSPSEAEALKTQLADRQIASGGVLEGGLPLPPPTATPTNVTREEKERRETTQAATTAATTAATHKPATEKPQKVQITQTTGEPIPTAPVGSTPKETGRVAEQLGEHVSRAVGEAHREAHREGTEAQRRPSRQDDRNEALAALKQRLVVAEQKLAESTELTAAAINRAKAQIDSARIALVDRNIGLATRRVQNAEGTLTPPAQRDQQKEALLRRVEQAQLAVHSVAPPVGVQHLVEGSLDKAGALLRSNNIPAATRQVESAEQRLGIAPVVEQPVRAAEAEKVPAPIIVPHVDPNIHQVTAEPSPPPIVVPHVDPNVHEITPEVAPPPIIVPHVDPAIHQVVPEASPPATVVPHVDPNIHAVVIEKAAEPTKVPVVNQEVYRAEPEHAGAATKIPAAKQEVVLLAPEKAAAAKKVPAVMQEVQHVEPEAAGPAKKVGHRHQRVQKVEPEEAGAPRKVPAKKQQVQHVEVEKAAPPVKVGAAKQQVDKVVPEQATVRPVTPEQAVEVARRRTAEEVTESRAAARRARRIQPAVETPAATAEPIPVPVPASGGGGRRPPRPPAPPATPPPEEPLVPGNLPPEKAAEGRARIEEAIPVPASSGLLEALSGELTRLAEELKALFSRTGPTRGALTGTAVDDANRARLQAGLGSLQNARIAQEQGEKVNLNPDARAVEALNAELEKLQARIAQFQITTQPQREAFTRGSLLGTAEVNLGQIQANKLLKETLGIPGGLFDVRGQASGATRETRQTTEILGRRRQLGETNPERLAGKDLEGFSPEHIAQIHELYQQNTRAVTQAGARQQVTPEDVGIFALNRALQQEIAARTAAAAAELSNVELLAASNVVTRRFNDDLKTATDRLTDIGRAGTNLAARQHVTAGVQTQAATITATTPENIDQLVALAIANASKKTAVTQGLAGQGLNRQGETVEGEVTRRGASALRSSIVNPAVEGLKNFLGIGKTPPKPPPTQEELVQEALTKRAQKANVTVGVEENVRTGTGFTDADRQAEALAAVLRGLNQQERQRLQNALAVQVTGQRPTVFQAFRYYSRQGGGGGGGGEGGPLGALGEPTPGSFFLRHATNLAGYAIPGIAFGVLFEGLRTAVEDAATTQKTLAEIEAEFQALGQGGQFQGFSQSVQNIATNTGVAVNEVAELGLAFKGVFGSTIQATQAIQSAAEGVQALGVPVAQLQEDLTGISQAFDGLRQAGGGSVKTIENQALHFQDIFGVPAKQTLAGTADIGAIAQQQGLSFKFTSGLVAATAQRTGLSGTDIGEAFSRILPGFTTNLTQLLQQTLPLGKVAQPFVKAVETGNNQQAIVSFLHLLTQLGSGAQYSLIQTLGGNPSSRAVLLSAAQAFSPPKPGEQSTISKIESKVPADRLQQEFNKQIGTVAGRLEQLDNAIQQLFVNILNSNAGSGIAAFVEALRSGVQFLVQFNNTLHGLPVEIAATVLALKLIQSTAGAARTVYGITQGKLPGLNTEAFNEAVTTSGRSFLADAQAAGDDLLTKATQAGEALKAGGVAGGTAEKVGGVEGGAAEKLGGVEGGAGEKIGGLTGDLGKGVGTAGVVAGAEGGASLLASSFNVALLAAVAFEVVQELANKYPQQAKAVTNAVLHPPGQSAEVRFVNRNFNDLPGSSPTSQGEAAYNKYLDNLAGSSQQFKVQAQERVNLVLQASGVNPHAVNQEITHPQGLRVGGEFGPGVAQALRGVEEGIKKSGKVESPELVAELKKLSAVLGQTNTKVQQYGGFPFITPPKVPASRRIVTQAPESVNAATGPEPLPGAASLGPESINAGGVTPVPLKIPPYSDFTGLQTAYQESGASFAKLVAAAKIQTEAARITFQTANNQQQPAAFEALQTAVSNQKQIYDTQAQTIAQFASQFIQQGSPAGALQQLAISYAQLGRTQSISGIQQAIASMVQSASAVSQTSSSFALSTTAANTIMEQGFNFTKGETQTAIGSLERYGVSYNNAVKLLQNLGVQFQGGLLHVPGAVVTPTQQFAGLQQQIEASQSFQVAQAFENQPQIAQINVNAIKKQLAFFQAQQQKGTPGAALQVQSYQAQLTAAVNARTDTANQVQQAQAQLQAAVVGQNPVAAAQAQAHEGEIALALARAHHNDPAAMAQAETTIVSANQQLAIALNAVTQAQAGFYQAVFTGAPVQAAQAAVQQGQAALAIAVQNKNKAAQFAALQSIASAQYQRAQAVVSVVQAQTQIPISVTGVTGGLPAAQATVAQAQAVLRTTTQQQTQLYNNSPVLQSKFPTATAYLAQNTDFLNAQNAAASAKGAIPAAAAAQVQTLGAAAVAATANANPLVQASAQLNLDLNSYSTLIQQLAVLWHGPQKQALQKQYGSLTNLIAIAGAGGNQAIISDIVSKTNAEIQAFQTASQTPVARASIIGGLPQAIASQTAAYGVLIKSINSITQGANAEYNQFVKEQGAAQTLAQHGTRQQFVSGQVSQSNQSGAIATNRQTYLQALGATLQASATQIQSLGSVSVALAGSINPVVGASAQLTLDVQTQNDTLTRLNQSWQAQKSHWEKLGYTHRTFLQSSQQLNSEQAATYGQIGQSEQAQLQQIQTLGGLQQAQLGLKGQPIIVALAGVQSAEEQVNVSVRDAGQLWNKLTATQKKQYGNLQTFTSQTQGFVQSQTNLATAQSTYQQSLVSQTENVVNSELTLGQITVQQGIAQLYASLAKVKGNQAATLQVETDIRQLQNSAGQNLSFNLPTTLIPSTLYAARLAEATGGAFGPTGQQTNNVTINVNGGSATSIQQGLNKFMQVVGAPTTALPSVALPRG